MSHPYDPAQNACAVFETERGVRIFMLKGYVWSTVLGYVLYKFILGFL